ncbi:MAG: aldehyde ferredoxin oxidoreductase family protein [Dehalococcoidia bacterium]|nr:aldehyde ferredoxin oxidoreductase family protein [Dehalococcoidia bacterium]
MHGGYMGRFLFVNLTTGELKIEEPDEKLLKDYIGGYGIGVRLLYSMMKPGVDPLGPDNILGFAAGPLSGTRAPHGSRYTVFAKSPLTGGWGDANSGGDFGPGMKFAGFDAVFFSGISSKPVYLLLDSGKASLKDAGHLWGKDSNETEDILQKELGAKVQVSCIGPSGEKLSLISCVMNNKGRAAGRSGLGAVMGSKRLKAVVAKGGLTVPVSDNAGLIKFRREAIKNMTTPAGQLFQKYGTAAIVAASSRSGDAPIKNWGGVGVVDFPNGAAISDEAVIAYQSKKYGCYLCPTPCGGIMKAVSKDYELEAGSHKPEYETLAAFGTVCLNDNLESIIVANDICNRYGLDTISAGAVLGFALECYDNGLIDKGDTGGIELTWGNHKTIIEMLEKLAKREGFGDILADGVKKAAEKIGKNAADYAIHVGGQEVAMHDSRLAEHYYATYKFDATPGRHTQARPGSHVLNSSGACLIGNILMSKENYLNKSLALVTGWERTDDELKVIDERILNLRHAFNLREGINPNDRKLPGRLVGQPPQTEGPLAGKSIDTAAKTAAFLALRGWDPITFKPTKEKLLDLGLDDVAEDIL